MSQVRIYNFINIPLEKIARNGQEARSTKILFSVERASCPFQNLIKRTFAIDLIRTLVLTTNLFKI
jgi:hypothetical protein